MAKKPAELSEYAQVHGFNEVPDYDKAAESFVGGPYLSDVEAELTEARRAKAEANEPVEVEADVTDTAESDTTSADVDALVSDATSTQEEVKDEQ